MISAFDYRRFCRINAARPCRLLFVAHREEILRQSQETFQGVLKDQNFGELFVGNHKPESLDNLFVSIQTMNSQALHEKLPEDYYDFIIVESHDSKIITKKLLSILPLWYNGSSFFIC